MAPSCRPCQARFVHDGEWINLADSHGAMLGAVCIVGANGQETVLSEFGDRMVPIVPGLFENAATGQRYVVQERSAAADEAGEYRVAFEPADGYVRLRIDGDFRYTRTVDREWDVAFECLGKQASFARVLILRGPGRMANDLAKLQQLQRFTSRGHHVERIAAILPPGESSRGSMFVTVAALRGLVVQMFESESEAADWLRR